ncbi:unnamed protein product [Periconia digitata]|uniref:Uncharacterized protein n=1 Tax=Periconia digitata TaxID=1303443 RepID=A0A9W4XGD3_9PLEO|nr:unnamed protein product [Periconia digitata]
MQVNNAGYGDSLFYENQRKKKGGAGCSGTLHHRLMCSAARLAHCFPRVTYYRYYITPILAFALSRSGTRGERERESELSFGIRPPPSTHTVQASSRLQGHTRTCRISNLSLLLSFSFSFAFVGFQLERGGGAPVPPSGHTLRRSMCVYAAEKLGTTSCKRTARVGTKGELCSDTGFLFRLWGLETR